MSLKRFNIVIILSFLAFLSEGYTVFPNKSDTSNDGKVWTVEDWPDSSRLYPKKLSEREGWYQAKNGEAWRTPTQYGPHILSPGTWNWSVVGYLPYEISVPIRLASTSGFWGGTPAAYCYAPFGSDTVTDLYAAFPKGFVHLDMKSGKYTVVGDLYEKGSVDGFKDSARLDVQLTMGNYPVIDPVTGRIFLAQDEKLRFVEKLSIFKDNTDGKLYLLPSFLLNGNLYNEITAPSGGSLSPVAGSDPIFIVKTTLATQIVPPGAVNRGRRNLISNDGRFVVSTIGGVSVWRGSVSPLAPLGSSCMLDLSHAVDFITGQTLFNVNMVDSQPPDVSEHGGSFMGYNNEIYVCQGGSAQNNSAPGTMMRAFSLDIVSGKITIHYQSATPWVPSTACWDGPADANTIGTKSTFAAVQCPRSGAIYNGGWDNSGIRRYKDGFVTTLCGGKAGSVGRPEWNCPQNMTEISEEGAPSFSYHNGNPAVAPNGDLYFADQYAPRFFKVYRTDWSEEQPSYGYAEQFMPRDSLRKLMLAYAHSFEPILFADETPPLIERCWAINDSPIITIVFSEPVDKESAENVTNYSISGGVSVSTARLLNDNKTVLLNAAGLALSGNYTAIVNNVNDISNEANSVLPNTEAHFTYTIPLQFTEVMPSNYAWDVMYPGKYPYVESNTAKINVCPQKYWGLPYLRTDYDDRTLTGDSVVSFVTNKPVIVYVAYHDAQRDTGRLPLWLSSNFSDNGDDIKDSTSKSHNVYSLYERSFPMGNIVLGGNNGIRAYYNYFVIVRPADSLLPPPLVTVADKAELSAQSQPALSAYPNPFNPSIRINFIGHINSVGEFAIYNIRGAKVADFSSVDKLNQARSKGVIWDASRNSSGVYIVRLSLGGKTIIKSIMLVR
jgi:hypothetical protein